MASGCENYVEIVVPCMIAMGCMMGLVYFFGKSLIGRSPVSGSGKIHEQIWVEEAIKATRPLCYSKTDGRETTCCICLGEFEEQELLRELPCDHCFHHSCLEKWLQKSTSCPLCRSSLQQPSTTTAPDDVGLHV
eukprot:s2003_g4.t1